MIDIDYFKKINDTYGHDIGDTVLIDFANILMKSVRDDDVVVRYGGEEFVIVMTATQKEVLLRKAESIRYKIIKSKFSINEHITASFGVASDNGEHNMDEVIKNADIALYQAKENGRNQVVIYED